VSTGRLAVAALLAAVLAWLGWEVIQTTRADQTRLRNTADVLRMDPDDPKALLSQAWAQMARGQDTVAVASARHLLRVAPGEGDAFAVIALVALRKGAPDAPRLMNIALKRAPRVREVHAQAAAMRLKAGDLEGALVQIDALLRLQPELGARFFPGLFQLAGDQHFADLLSATLARNPPWRGALLAQLNSEGDPAALDGIYSRLRAKGALSEAETTRWLERVIVQGRWGDAFAYWVGTLRPAPTKIPAVRNGGFEADISGMGFDWHNVAAAGAFTDVPEGAGPDGSRAAHVHFIGRPAAQGNLHQPLLLAPGHYRLSLQARGEFLHSDQGLQWVVRCYRGPLVAVTEGLGGTFGWKRISTDFEVPASALCSGQWLELRNPAVVGSAQQVTGDLWVDDVAITPLNGARH
jgi:hypothetical protein